MTFHHDPARTGLLLVDPYNDFLSEGGKLWPRLKEVAGEVHALDHLRTIVDTARRVGVQVFFVPHHRWEPGDYEDWKFPTPTQVASAELQTFAKGTWGGAFHDGFQVQPSDVVIKEHWAQSGFANTDLDHQLRQRGIDHVVTVGMLANTCIESTSRSATELGYHTTLVRDATAALSREGMHTAHEINGPTFAHAIVTTDELVTA